MYSKINVFVNYYDILGVHKNASFEEIKSAFHQKALSCHPDKNTNADSTEKMQQLNEAYDALKDEFSRRLYDNSININKAYSETTPSFFNQNRQSPIYEYKFTFEQWTAQLYGYNLFIYHPSLHGCKNNITIFKYSTIALPINLNIHLQRRVRNFLLSLSNTYSGWIDNQVEFLFDLPNDRKLSQKILDGIFNMYKMPKEVVDYVCHMLRIPPINHSQNNQSFEDLFEPTDSNYTKAQLGKWELSLTAAHLFIAHPSLKGCKNNISFFNIYTDPSIALPINGNQSIKEYLVKNIAGLTNYSPNDCNDVEMLINLPKDKRSLEKMLDVVFYIYNFPEDLIKHIQKLVILIENSHCNASKGLFFL